MEVANTELFTKNNCRLMPFRHPNLLYIPREAVRTTLPNLLPHNSASKRETERVNQEKKHTLSLTHFFLALLTFYVSYALVKYDRHLRRRLRLYAFWRILTLEKSPSSSTDIDVVLSGSLREWRKRSSDQSRLGKKGNNNSQHFKSSGRRRPSSSSCCKVKSTRSNACHWSKFKSTSMRQSLY